MIDAKLQISSANRLELPARALVALRARLAHVVGKDPEPFSRNRRLQPRKPVEMMRRGGMGDTGPRGAFAQSQRLYPALFQEVDPGAHQGVAQVPLPGVGRGR